MIKKIVDWFSFSGEGGKVGILVLSLNKVMIVFVAIKQYYIKFNDLLEENFVSTLSLKIW